MVFGRKWPVSAVRANALFGYPSDDFIKTPPTGRPSPVDGQSSDLGKFLEKSAAGRNHIRYDIHRLF